MTRAIDHLNADPTDNSLANLRAIIVPYCHHCQEPIEHDGTDSWRHVNGFYSCMERGEWNQATPEADL